MICVFLCFFFYLPFQNNKYFNYNDILTQLQKKNHRKKKTAVVLF